MKKIWAFDLGTSCGYAIGGGGMDVSGVLNLKPSRFDSSGMRFVRFRGELDKLREYLGVPDIVVYEEVRRHMGVDAAHCYGGLMAVLTAWCVEHQVNYEGVPVGTIKKFATGKGNATKEMMIEAAKVAGYPVTSDDQADAIHLLRYKMNEVLA